MQFTSFSDFLAMGGYGFYVWLSYGVTALLLIILVIASNKQNKAVIAHIRARQKRENKLRLAAALQKQQQVKNDNDSKEVLS
ncbi:MAG: heme exporter protein CcmD [Colwellia sp.]|nr:heme exporter protein CcmD [Colwellia sp.]